MSQARELRETPTFVNVNINHDGKESKHMTKLIQETFEQISQLNEEQQNTLAIYLQKHLHEFLQKAEKEKRIEEGNYRINDFNQETQETIQNIEEKRNLTVCKNKNELYNELGI